MRKVALVSLCALGALWGGAMGLAACGGDDNTNNNLPDGSSGDDSSNQPDNNNNNPDTNPGGDSGGQDTGGGDTGGDSGGGKPYVADLVASATSIGGNTTYSLTVTLEQASAFSVPGSTCAGTKVGNCCYNAAVVSDAGVDAGEAGAPLSAGNITVNDGDSGADGSTVTLTPPDYHQTPFPLTWTGGDLLDVTAVGADIHAFSGPLQTATDFLGVSPALTLGTMTVDHTAAFNITWTAENKVGELGVLIMSGVNGSALVGSILCVVPEGGGAINVDATLVGKFSAGNTMSVILERAVPNIISTDDNAAVYLSGAVVNVGSGTFN
jgi:hypothetical protein